MNHRIVIAAAGLAAVGAAVLATAALAASGPTSPRDKGLFAYASCMRGKGVDIPDPVKQPGGVYAFPKIPATVTGAAGVRAKAQACAKTAGFGQGGAGGFRRQQLTPAQQAQLAKFRACLKEHGVTLPSFGQRPAGQTPPANGRRPRGGGGGFRSNPAFQKAFQACQSLSPVGARPGGSTTN